VPRPRPGWARSLVSGEVRAVSATAVRAAADAPADAFARWRCSGTLWTSSMTPTRRSGCREGEGSGGGMTDPDAGCDQAA
jgi:hypothetical protein